MKNFNFYFIILIPCILKGYRDDNIDLESEKGTGTEKGYYDGVSNINLASANQVGTRATDDDFVNYKDFPHETTILREESIFMK